MPNKMSFKSLTAKYQANYNRLQRIVDKVKDGSIAELQENTPAYLEVIEKCWVKHEENIEMMLEKYPEQYTEWQQKEAEFEDLYFQAKRLVQPIIKYKNEEKPTRPGFKLPAIPLPEFNGAYDKWYTFKSMFSMLIENQCENNDVLKLYYLKSALKGEAAMVLDSELINGNDFQAAWEAIRSRFENKRYIVERHVNCLLKLKKIVKGTSFELRHCQS